YDRSEDILYLMFKKGQSNEIVEGYDNTIVELDKEGKLMGVEIRQARKSGFIKQLITSVKQEN
ncbi:MAG: DUF2283 domain-containing protein, partial [Nitrososphaerales archaeon]